MTFPVSGVEVSPLVPLLVGLAVALVTSTGGVSGGFLLPPFQVSLLGFAAPAVSPTSLVYNLVAIPSGVYGYIREGRMAWPLTGVIVAGSVPGAGLGAVLRIEYLPDPESFKLFVGCVLLCVGGRLLYDVARPARCPGVTTEARRGSAGTAPGTVRTVAWSWRRIAYRFSGETFSFSPLAVLPLAFVVGVVSGAYGIGGGAIMGPVLVAFFGLPVYTVAGAVLLGTFLTSLAGLAFYWLAAVHYAGLGLAVGPDWLLGGLFGLGGAVGMYVGARCQKYVPARAIKLMLSLVLLVVAVRYVSGFWA